MKTISTTIALLLCASAQVPAQGYTYLPEGFEGDEWQANKPATVTSATGTWTTNKNQSSADQAHGGARSLYFSAKDGLMSPMLAEGAGYVIYYVHDTNREMHVEASRDGQTWTDCETYKLTADWTRHVAAVGDTEARYVRFRTTSNGGIYLDDILITKPDGTDAEGTAYATDLRLPYFTQDFEDRSQYPGSKSETEATFDIPGQGEWKYCLAYRNTNASYIPDASACGLRMTKNGSYVVTPVLAQGVVEVTFDEGRGSRKLTLYTSRDGGETWERAADITSDVHNSVLINDKDVNRLKLANESSSDADIDNLCVTAFPQGTPATVATLAADGITSSSATLSGSVTSPGDRPLVGCGFCWSTEGTPTLSSATVTAETATDFTATLTGLPAGTPIQARAYALTLAGVAYGETLTFTTLDPSIPTVITGDAEIDETRSDETAFVLRVDARVADHGGLPVTEAGVCWGTAAEPTVDGKKVIGYPSETDGSYSVYLTLAPETSWHIRAYATNGRGTAYGDEVVFTTGSIVLPEYPHNVYYCSPEGNDATADGSQGAPYYSLQKAVDRVQPGDTIYMMAGTYKYAERVNIGVIGQKGSGMIALHSLGGRAVLDFGQQAVDAANQGIRHTGSYWHYYGLDIINAGDNGLLIERNKPSGGSYTDIAANTEQGHDNLIENCAFVRNADTGLQMKNLASFNKVVNCDAYYNTDPDHGDADGFAVKISHGDGNYFYGCRAWQNSDDGWDQFIKKEGGFPDDITTTLEYCWAFRNGILEDGTASKGNGNGFKMGSNEGRNNVIMNRCLAFENVNKGFDQNHNTGHMILNNCTGYSAKDTSSKSRYTYRIDEPVASGHIIRLTNCVAVSDGIADRNKSDYAPHSVKGELVTCDLNTLPADYVSVDWKDTTAPRNADGSLPVLDFMRIRPGNDKLIDKGSEVIPFDGQHHAAEGILFNGLAPDLGCFETGEPLSGITDVTLSPSGRKLELTSTRSGLRLVTVRGASADEQFILRIHDIAGRLIAAHSFAGATTAVNLAGYNGAVIISVSSATETMTLKAAY